jgi:hypothetical protein
MSKHWHSNHSQVYWTCMALAQGRAINHMDEIGEVKGWRLGAIIHNLRKSITGRLELSFEDQNASRTTAWSKEQIGAGWNSHARPRPCGKR